MAVGKIFYVNAVCSFNFLNYVYYLCVTFQVIQHVRKLTFFLYVLTETLIIAYLEQS